MLLTLNEAVPERPSKPLSISPSQQNLRSAASPSKVSEGVGSVESQLSNSGSTVESSGPSTPNEGDISLSGRPHTASSRPTSIYLDARSRRSNPAPPLRLGKTLLPILPFLKQYSLFVANFSGSLSRLSQLERSNSNGWGQFVKSRKVSQQGGKIGLGGMLLNVVQRVPRYRLLLGELIEYTEEGHPDLECLRKAFELVDSGELYFFSFTDSRIPLISLAHRSRKSSRLTNRVSHSRFVNPESPKIVFEPRLSPPLARTSTTQIRSSTQIQSIGERTDSSVLPLQRLIASRCRDGFGCELGIRDYWNRWKRVGN